jgi:hypothetical protein
MGEFQLILLSEANRPVREARPSGAFSLIPFRSRTGAGMAADVASVTTDELATWLTPDQALSAVSQALGKDAGRAIWERLHGGMIRAVAGSSSRATPPNAEPLTTLSPTNIPARYWGHFSHSKGPDFWQTGDAKFFFGSKRPRVEASTVVRCFDIRLDPVGVRAMIPPESPKRRWIRKPAEASKTVPPPPQPKPQPESLSPGPPYYGPPTPLHPGGPSEMPKVEEAEPEQTGPPVAQIHLKAWYDLYRQAYSGSADTEATALKSARGMFPGKSVSRDRVRALRGSQKRGRKPTEIAK